MAKRTAIDELISLSKASECGKATSLEMSIPGVWEGEVKVRTLAEQLEKAKRLAKLERVCREYVRAYWAGSFTAPSMGEFVEAVAEQLGE